MIDLAEYLERLPGASEWPALLEIARSASQAPRADWELPLIACEAFGGAQEEVEPAEAAVAFMQISIILVDDILDNDPRGMHHQLGVGATANAALALQIAAFRVLEDGVHNTERCMRACAILSRLGFDTALGQELDTRISKFDEESYWRIVSAKSTPFYSAALELGGVLAGASQETSAGLARLGTLLGEMVQVHDDLDDAFRVPAAPDWVEKRLNLPILFASSVEHPEKEHFSRLRQGSLEEERLAAAQQILIRSGALSYCIYHLIERYRRGQQLVQKMELANHEVLEKVLDRQVRPVVNLLEEWGIEVPGDLRHLQ